MKILFIIGDLWENSIDRQLAEIVQELLDGEAETEILESFELSPSTINSVKQADAVWFIIHNQNGNYPDVLSKFLENTAHIFINKHCALAAIGGNDGGKKSLKKLYENLIKLNLNVFDTEVTCVPLKTERFECPKEYLIDLYWQKEAFLQVCQIDNTATDREQAILTVANNYFTLMKGVSKNNCKPTQIKINYPNIITDVGTFDFLHLSANLKELYYEIDALSSDYNIDNKEIEFALKNIIDNQW